MNALTDYFNGTRALSSADVGRLARGLTLAHPKRDLTADTQVDGCGPPMLA
jgi:hypothetical protein